MHSRPHVDAGRIRVGNRELGPSRVAIALRAGATAGLALKSRAGRVGSFFAPGWFACRGHKMGSFAAACASASRRSILLTLLSGLIATASRRNLTHAFIAWLRRTMLLIGLSELTLSHQC